MSRGIIPVAAALAGCGLLLAGCGYAGPASLPLPEGASVGADPYRVTVVFDDVGNLAPKGSCRTNDVPVGLVESIELGDDLRPRVVCLLNSSVTLPANTVARLSETGLLGERFVALGPPRGQPPCGELKPGAVLDSGGNQADAGVEQVLGALSAVLNGGSIERIQTINEELNTALSGREPRVRGLLEELASVTTTLNRHRGDISRALDLLDRLSGTLAERHEAVGSAIDAVPEGLRVLNRQQDQLVRLLRRTAHLSEVATPLIERSRRDTVDTLELLRPVLSELSKAGGQLTDALRFLSTFPFPENAVRAMKGDYFGLYLTVNVNMDSLSHLLGRTGQSGSEPPAEGQRPAPTPRQPPLVELPELPPAPRTPPDLGDLLPGGR